MVKSEKRTEDLSRTQIRGSTLLLLGRLISTGLKFGTQVLLVRYLSISDYGSFAYALSVVGFCQIYTTLGLHQGVNRFIPIYHERRETGKLLGTLLLVLAAIAATGAATVLAVYLRPEWVGGLLKDERLPLIILSVLVFLVPLEAFDRVLVQLFACFGKPNAIFFRKYVLGPVLNFVVVLLLVTFQQDVLFVAYGYLLSSLMGLLLYLWVLIAQFKAEGIWENLRFDSLRIPTGELFQFSLPLLTSDLYAMIIGSFAPMAIAFYHPTSEVAFYRAVLPAANLNAIVAGTTAILFTPAAARLFARKDFSGLADMYWRTATWTAVLSFPIFLITFALARPLASLLFGPEYENSGLILALLSVGLYFDSAIGHNGATLKAMGKVRYLVSINLVSTAVYGLGTFLLVPRHGANGAAVVVCVTFLLHNTLKQLGLRSLHGMSLFHPGYYGLYVIMGGAAASLAILCSAWPIPFGYAFALAALVSLGLLLITKRKLNLAETFPELMRIPLARRILA